MDKQGRLTKVDEWQIGKDYAWRKGKVTRGTYTCVEIRRGIVTLLHKESGHHLPYSPNTWRNRYVRLHP